MIKKFLSIIFCICLVSCMIPVQALAVTSLTVKVNGTFLKDVNNVFTVNDDAAVVEVNGDTTIKRIEINSNNVTVNLNNISIKLNEVNFSPVIIAQGKTVKLNYVGSNSIKGYAAGPGILVGNDAEIIISGADSGSLRVEGAQMNYFTSGEVSGGFSSGFAGIGSLNFEEHTAYSGKITVLSGHLEVVGYGSAAAIGGGNYADGGIINIKGGVVCAENKGDPLNGWTSNSTSLAPAIGGGYGGSCGSITISGNADVVAYGGAVSAAIGGKSGEIFIKNTASVTAFANKDGMGIGGSKDVMLSIDNTAKMETCSSGKNPALLATPAPNSTAILNINLSKINLLNKDLTLTGLDGTERSVTVLPGTISFAKTFDEGKYIAENQAESGTFRYVSEQDNSLLISTSYDEVTLKAYFISDDGTITTPDGITVCPNKKGINPAFNEENATITVPSGSKVTNANGKTSKWIFGGEITKDGKFCKNPLINICNSDCLICRVIRFITKIITYPFRYIVSLF